MLCKNLQQILKVGISLNFQKRIFEYKKILYLIILLSIHSVSARPDPGMDGCFPPYCIQNPSIIPKGKSNEEILNPPLNVKYKPQAFQIRGQVLQMVIMQEFLKDPNTYLAFAFAARGKYSRFENVQKNFGFKKILDLGRNVNVKLKFPWSQWVEVSIDIPLKSQTNRIVFTNVQQDLENFKRVTHATAQVLMECKDNMQNCPIFRNLFKEINDPHELQELQEGWSKAIAFANKNGINVFQNNTIEDLQFMYPLESNLVQTLNNSEDIKKQTEAFKDFIVLQEEDRVAHIQANDPFYTGKDATTLHLQNKWNEYQTQLEQIKQQQLIPNQTTEELVHLSNEETRTSKALERIDTAKKLYKNEQLSNGIIAVAGATKAVGQVLGVPKEIIQLADIVIIKTQIISTVNKMIISGAVDPTGITAIAIGLSALLRIISNTPSPEQLMKEVFDDIQKKLETVLVNQEQILAELEYMKDLMQKNHREIIDNLGVIQKRLHQIETSMQFNFEAVFKEFDTQTFKEIMGRAYGLRTNLSKPIHQQQVCLEKDENNQCVMLYNPSFEDIRESGRLLGEIYKNWENISQMDIEKDFSKLSKEDIEKYIENPSIEARLPFLSSMVHWLNSAEDRLNTLSVGRKIRTQIPSDLIFGKNIPEPPKEIALPSYQDKILSEYIELASLLPPESDDLGGMTHDDHVDKMCQRLSSIESLSKTMRENLQKAWATYYFYSITIYNNVVNYFDDLPRKELKLKANKSKKELRNEKDAHESKEELRNEKDAHEKDALEKIPLKSFISTANRVYFHEHPSHQHPKPPNISRYFSNFSSILNDVLDDMLNNTMSDRDMYIHGYIKQVPYRERKCIRQIMVQKKIEVPQDKILLPPPCKDFTLGDLIMSRGSGPDGGYGGGPGPEGGYVSSPKCRKTITLQHIFAPRTRWKSHCYEWEKVGTGPIKYRIENDRESFKKAQIEEWRWVPTYIYTHIIKELDKKDLIAEWMRAKLAVDTMAHIGYGEQLSSHPKLSMLNKLIKTLPARREPSSKEPGHIYQFFKDIEAIRKHSDSPFLINYAHATASRINLYRDESNQVSPLTFINPILFTGCETEDFRVKSTIFNTHSIMNLLNSSSQKIEKKFSHYMKKEKSPQFTSSDELIEFLQTILEEAVENKKPFDVFTYMKEQNLHFLLDLNKQNSNQRRIKPFCSLSFVELSSQKSQKYIYHSFMKIIHPVVQMSFKEWQRNRTFGVGDWEQQVMEHWALKEGISVPSMFYLPLPSEDLWKNQPIGLGIPELRRQALFKAGFYEHLKPKYCSLVQ